MVWYQLDTNALAVVCEGGIFVGPANAATWDWHPTGTKIWDNVHQRIFRQHRADRLDGPPEGVRPPTHADMDDADPHEVIDSLGVMARDRGLLRWLGPIGERVAYVLLVEDEYESRHGDGLFREFVACVPSEEAVASVPVADGLTRHIRRLGLRRVDGAIEAIPERRDFADRYTIEEALLSLRARLPE
jgi:hypothetical protein